MQSHRSPVLLAMVALAGSIWPQGGTSPGQSAIRRMANPAPGDVLQALDVGRATIQDLDLPTVATARTRVPVNLAGGMRELILAPHSIRDAGFSLLLQNGGLLTEIPATQECTVRGVVEGIPGSIVAGSVYQGSLNAVIFLGGEQPLWGIQPLLEIRPGSPARTHVVFNSGDNLPLAVRCGADDLPQPVGGTTNSGQDHSGIKICDIACDSDVEFFNSNSSSITITTNNITNVINALDAIYQRDAGIQYNLTTVLVRSSEPDPYSSSSASTLLGELQSHWNSSQGTVVRDVAHLFTGKALDGGTIGVSYTGVVCDLQNAYGLSASNFSSNVTNRTALTAHEFGHNWSASHCDGANDCKLMCSTLGACTGSLTAFGATAANLMDAYKHTVECLADPIPPATPFLFFSTPTTLQAFQGGPLIISGMNLSVATNVQIGLVSYSTPGGFTIDSDSQITVPNPVADTLGLKVLTVDNSLGTSNGLFLSYNPTNPPALTSPAAGVGGTQFDWEYGADPGDYYFLMVSVGDNSTIPLAGFNILFNSRSFIFNPNGAQLNTAGIGNTSVVPPVGVLVGFTVFSQVLTFSDQNFLLSGVTNIPATPF